MGMLLDWSASVLYVVNSDRSTACVYVMARRRYANRETQAVKKLRNSSLAMWGAAYQNEQLFTSKTSAPGGIYVFEDIANVGVNDRDSVGRLDPTRILFIEGAENNLRGLF